MTPVEPLLVALAALTGALVGTLIAAALITWLGLRLVRRRLLAGGGLAALGGQPPAPEPTEASIFGELGTRDGSAASLDDVLDQDLTSDDRREDPPVSFE